MRWAAAKEMCCTCFPAHRVAFFSLQTPRTSLSAISHSFRCNWSLSCPLSRNRVTSLRGGGSFLPETRAQVLLRSRYSLLFLVLSVLSFLFPFLSIASFFLISSVTSDTSRQAAVRGAFSLEAAASETPEKPRRVEAEGFHRHERISSFSGRFRRFRPATRYTCRDTLDTRGPGLSPFSFSFPTRGVPRSSLPCLWKDCFHLSLLPLPLTFFSPSSRRLAFLPLLHTP